MATVFGVDLNEIDDSKPIRSHHVRSVYGVLGGIEGYNKIDHQIKFTGSIAAGDESEVDEGTIGFAFGVQNRVKADSGFAVGRNALAHAPAQFALSGGSISQPASEKDSFGDAQRTATVRSLVSTGGRKRIEVPTQPGSFINLKARIVGSEYENSSSSTKAGAEGIVLFFNTYGSEEGTKGVILNGGVDWTYMFGAEAAEPDVAEDIQFEAAASNFTLDFEAEDGRLYFVVDDSRSEGSDEFRWTIFFDAVEVSLGIEFYDGYGYGYGYDGYGYNNSISAQASKKGGTAIGLFADSKVLERSGDFVKASDIQKGDRIVSLYIPDLSRSNWHEFRDCQSDGDHYTISEAEVTGVWHTFLDGYFKINGTKFPAEQRLYVQNKEDDCFGWQLVEELDEDKHLLYKGAGELVRIESKEYIEKEVETVVITLQSDDGSFTYFADDFLTHNE